MIQLLPILLTVLLATSGVSLAAVPSQVEFNRDVRPLLAQRCFQCHGADHESREGELRLDVRDRSNETAIVEGDADASELIDRVTTNDPDRRMPPPESDKPALTDDEVSILRRWINQGAPYEKHWSFRPPVRHALPRVSVPDRCRTPIDHFVLARLDQQGLAFAKHADRYTLIRRVALDLTGLPPSIEQVEQVLADSAPGAYERLVDRLLASPHFGERWALWWLDAARYADSNGYEVDRTRSIWPYRDWVIQALNRDLPFDQFTIEQLAGDLLPNPTIDQRIATGFHRNTFINEEGGHDWEQFRYESIVDRVHTTSAVFLGLTLACAQCHDHKYDPISQREYFEVFALLNNDDEPELEVPNATIQARQAEVDAEIERVRSERDRNKPTEQQFQDWCEDEARRAVPWRPIDPISAVSKNNATMTKLDDGSLLVTGDRPELDSYRIVCDTDQPRITGFRLEAIPDRRLPNHGPGRGSVKGDGTFVVTEFAVRAHPKSAPSDAVTLKFAKAFATLENDSVDQAIDGNRFTSWHAKGGAGQRNVAVFQLDQPYECRGETRVVFTILQNYIHQQTLGRFKLYVTSDERPLVADLRSTEIDVLLLSSPADRSARQWQTLQEHYLSVAPELSEYNAQITKLIQSRPRFPTTFVLHQREKPRETHLHQRGEYLRPGEVVTGGGPKILHPLREGAPPNRLTLARWLVDRRNPLMARVIVNQIWQQYFGRGLVNTPNDFGTQGDTPSHPELLDWLATEFTRNDYSMKTLHHLIVTSATYRQSSAVSAEVRARDPDNVLIARGPRRRVDAELLRDIVLATSGLLEQRIGGPSVFPSVPVAVTGFGGLFRWQESQGADQFRRGLYTFRKRTAPYATFSIFDAPPANTCTLMRHQSNTPLQALAQLNDKLTLQASRALAHKILRNGPHNTRAELQFAYRTCVVRPPDDIELDELLSYYERQRQRLARGDLDAAQIAGTDKSPSNRSLEELAAWTIVSRLLLNLDEVITK